MRVLEILEKVCITFREGLIGGKHADRYPHMNGWVLDREGDADGQLEKDWSSTNGGTELEMPTDFGGDILILHFEFCLQKNTQKMDSH